MFKRLLVGTLVFLLSTIASAEAPAPLTAPSEFNYACTYAQVFYGVECGDLAPPLVITSRTVPSHYYGMHMPGEPYIFINKRLWLHDKLQWRTTVVHETMHYILHNRAPDAFPRCLSEEVARRAHSNYAGTPYDNSWRNSYRCNV